MILQRRYTWVGSNGVVHREDHPPLGTELYDAVLLLEKDGDTFFVKKSRYGDSGVSVNFNNAQRLIEEYAMRAKAVRFRGGF